LAAREIQVPDIGDFKNVEVIDLLVKAGDRVEAETPLLTLETEKATMDVPAPFAGVIEKLLVAKGSRVSAGTAIAILQSEAEAAAPAAAAAANAAAPAAPAAQPTAIAPPQRPRRALLQPHRWKCRCPTSAISRMWKSSTCWSRRAKPSLWIPRC